MRGLVMVDAARSRHRAIARNHCPARFRLPVSGPFEVWHRSADRTLRPLVTQISDLVLIGYLITPLLYLSYLITTAVDAPLRVHARYQELGQRQGAHPVGPIET